MTGSDSEFAANPVEAFAVVTDADATRFIGPLNELADRHEFLVSRSADLQSRIDEQLRAPALNDDGYDDVPF